MRPIGDRLMWWGIVLFAASLIFSTSIVQATVVLLALGWGFRLVRSRGSAFRRTPLDLPLLAFMLARLVSIALSVDPGRSLKSLRIELPFYLIYFVLTSEITPGDRRRLRWLVTIPVVAAAVAGLVGLTTFLLGAPRATSTTSGYYTLGGYLTAALAMALLLGRNRDLFPLRAWWTLASVSMLAGIICTCNRIHWGITAFLIAAVGLVRERRLALAGALAGGILVVLSPTVAERVREVDSWRDFLSGRDILWNGAAMIAGERPVFGHGTRTFRAIFPVPEALLDSKTGGWHNDYLQLYMESGIAGLGTYLWLIVAIYVMGFRALRKLRDGWTGDARTGDDSRFYRDVIRASLAAIATILAGGLTGGFVTDPLVSLFFRQLMAIVAIAALAVEAEAAGAIRAGGIPGRPRSRPGG